MLTASDLNAEFNSILNNAQSLISPFTGDLDFDGKTLTLDAAAATQVVSSAAISWNFTSGAKTGTPGTGGSVERFSAQTFTDSATAGSGTAAAAVFYSIAAPTLAATNALVTTTDAATWYIAGAPSAGTNETITNAWGLWIDAGNVRFDDDIHWLSGQTFAQRGILSHANTGIRTYTFPDFDGTIATLAGTETLSNKTLVAPALGTPGSGVLTNCTGTAAGLTAGNVTTNANLTGHVTSVGNAAVLGSFTVAQLNTAISDFDIGIVKLTSGAASGATLDIVMTTYTAYAHKLLVFDLIPATDGVTLLARFSTDGGGTYDAGASDYSFTAAGQDDTDLAILEGAVTNSMGLSTTNNVGNGATEGISGFMVIYNTTSTAKWTRTTYESSTISSDATPRLTSLQGGGARRTAQDTDAVRLLFSSGNITSGTYTLYGWN